MRAALRRIVAFLIDWLCILGWVAVTAAVGVPLYLGGVTRGLDTVALNVIATVVLVIPVVVAAAVFESRRRAATPGKRVLHLEVRHGSRAPRFGRALLRNLLKIGVPWVIGHSAVFVLATAGLAGTPTPPLGYVLLVAAYVLPIAYLVSLFAGSGRALYDRVAGTRVTLVVR
ncbi:hypothetical protein GCM10009840_32330 [Pseudolysinimonas kribbensis]